jgi:two-component system chemotaxis sensor kinase CheA
MDELIQDFIAETRETLEALAGEVVAWEADPTDRARLDAIFRFVHTVKGSCGFLDLPRLGRLSHAAEDVLQAAREGVRTPDRALVNAVLAVIDRIAALVEAIESETALDDSDEDALIAALAAGSDAVAAATSGPRTPPRSVRLNVDLLDRMMSGMSDMVLARNELARRLREMGVEPALEASLERLSATVAEMRDTVTLTRMQTIDALFSALPRLVRDTAAAVGKSVTLHVEGGDVELDREMIEVLRDPLMHIVRNAIDHGIEPPALRRLAGKRENGRLQVAARQSGNQIIVEIADDGQGIDVERIVAKLVRQGRDPRALDALSAKAKLDLVFEPGLSTRDEVTEISGRGVGMDVVRSAIEQIGGRIEFDNAPGRGLRIAIHVPLTLSIISTLVVHSRGQRFAIPRQAVEEIVSERAAAIRIDRLGDSGVATVRDRRMPIVDLAEQLMLGERGDAGPRMLVIVAIGAGSFAIAVDEVIDTEELVIKPGAPAVMATGLYAGQTLPDSGMPMLLLDCAGIAADAGLVFARVLEIEEVAANDAAPGVQALLFRDLDDVTRAIPVAVLDRVEHADAGAIRFTAGRLRLTADGAILPLATLGEIGARAQVGVLRLKDGDREIGYAIAEALDIVTLADDVIPAIGAGPIAGAVLHDGEPVELLDPHWLFAYYLDDSRGQDGALCVIDPDDPWMAGFVRPMLERAGYRVGTAAAAGERPVAVFVSAGGSEAARTDEVIRLRKTMAAQGQEDSSLYRYDRYAILAAVDERARAGGVR